MHSKLSPFYDTRILQQYNMDTYGLFLVNEIAKKEGTEPAEIRQGNCVVVTVWRPFLLRGG